jgi:hypothetical protein
MCYVSLRRLLFSRVLAVLIGFLQFVHCYTVKDAIKSSSVKVRSERCLRTMLASFVPVDDTNVKIGRIHFNSIARTRPNRHPPSLQGYLLCLYAHA